jgi:hypothetical protein
MFVDAVGHRSPLRSRLSPAASGWDRGRPSRAPPRARKRRPAAARPEGILEPREPSMMIVVAAAEQLDIAIFALLDLHGQAR